MERPKPEAPASQAAGAASKLRRRPGRRFGPAALRGRLGGDGRGQCGGVLELPPPRLLELSEAQGGEAQVLLGLGVGLGLGLGLSLGLGLGPGLGLGLGLGFGFWFGLEPRLRTCRLRSMPYYYYYYYYYYSYYYYSYYFRTCRLRSMPESIRGMEACLSLELCLSMDTPRGGLPCVPLSSSRGAVSSVYLVASTQVSKKAGGK